MAVELHLTVIELQLKNIFITGLSIDYFLLDKNQFCLKSFRKQ